MEKSALADWTLHLAKMLLLGKVSVIDSMVGVQKK